MNATATKTTHKPSGCSTSSMTKKELQKLRRKARKHKKAS